MKTTVFKQLKTLAVLKAYHQKANKIDNKTKPTAAKSRQKSYSK